MIVQPLEAAGAAGASGISWNNCVVLRFLPQGDICNQTRIHCWNSIRKLFSVIRQYVTGCWVIVQPPEAAELARFDLIFAVLTSNRSHAGVEGVLSLLETCDGAS